MLPENVVASCIASYSLARLQDLFRDEAKTEFVVVTIPSMLAVAETERLVQQLREQVRLFAVAFSYFLVFFYVFERTR